MAERNPDSTVIGVLEYFVNFEICQSVCLTVCLTVKPDETGPAVQGRSIKSWDLFGYSVFRQNKRKTFSTDRLQMILKKVIEKVSSWFGW